MEPNEKRILILRKAYELLDEGKPKLSLRMADYVEKWLFDTPDSPYYKNKKRP